jgi:hypothetical protein
MTSRLLDVVVDARGVAHSVREVRGASIGTETQEMALALGNVDFSQAKLINNKELPDECWRLSLPARNGQWCAETSASGINTVGKSLGIDVNTVEEGSQILDLLKRIAASYPDAAPQLTRVNGG